MTIERAFELAGDGLELMLIGVALIVAAPFMALGWIFARLGLVE